MNKQNISTIPSTFGLNIEGGFPYEDLSHIHGDDAIWSNIIFVLDRPLVDHLTFENVLNETNTKKYNMIERMFDKFNEHTMFSIMTTIITHYVKKYDEPIIVHIHQLSFFSHNIINLLKSMINKKMLENITFITDNNTYYESRNEIIEQYKKSRIVLSFSQCAGFNKDHDSGTIYIANEFIPFNVNTNTISINESYKIKNDIINNLENILNGDDYQNIIDYIDSNYFDNESNINKKYEKSVKLTLSDFIETKILQVDNLWNPDVNCEYFVNMI